MTRPARTELDPLGQIVSRLRYRAVDDNPEFSVWSIAVIDDLWPQAELDPGAEAMAPGLDSRRGKVDNARGGFAGPARIAFSFSARLARRETCPARWRCPTGECKPASVWIKANRLHTLISHCSLCGLPDTPQSEGQRWHGRPDRY
jgi:hypothetical protein